MPPFAKSSSLDYPCFTRTPKFHCGFGDNEQLINCVKPQSVSKEQVLNAESLLCFAEIILYPPCPHILASQLGLEKNNSSGAGHQSQSNRNRFCPQILSHLPQQASVSAYFHESYTGTQLMSLGLIWVNGMLPFPAVLHQEYSCKINEEKLAL